LQAVANPVEAKARIVNPDGCGIKRRAHFTFGANTKPEGIM
jgi:hypothetical protein